MVPALSEATKHNEEQVRREAVEALIEIGPEAKLAAFSVRILLNDPSPTMRLKAAKALWRIENRVSEVVPELVKATKDKDPSNRKEAIEVLNEIGSKAREAAPALLAAMKDADSEVRLRAVIALSKHGRDAKEATPGLIVFLNDEKIHDEAVKTLAAIGEDAVPLLTAALADTNHKVRLGAVVALGRVGPAAGTARRSLISLHRNDDVPAIREAAFEALGKIKQ